MESMLLSTNTSSQSVHNSGNISFCWTGGRSLNKEMLDNLKTLDSIKTLHEGWNNNGAPAFSAEIVNKVRSIILKLEQQPRVFPTGNE